MNAAEAKRTLRTVALVGFVGALVWAAYFRAPPKPAPRPDASAAPTPSSPASTQAEQPAELPLAVYLVPPAVGSYQEPDGKYKTTVRFSKTAGPWEPTRDSHFDLWFDGDVEPIFESRGFATPVNFDVQTPEPRHLAIKITSTPLDVTYVAFVFKSGHPVTLVRSDVSPKRGGDGADAGRDAR